jgi:hypothetical protein
MIRKEVALSVVVIGALSVPIISETIPFAGYGARKRTVEPAFLVYLTPHQQHGGAHDDEPHRGSRARVRIQAATVVTSISVSAPVALSSEIAVNLGRVSVSISIQNGRFVFGQEQYEST